MLLFARLLLFFSPPLLCSSSFLILFSPPPLLFSSASSSLLLALTRSASSATGWRSRAGIDLAQPHSYSCINHNGRSELTQLTRLTSSSGRARRLEWLYIVLENSAGGEPRLNHDDDCVQEQRGLLRYAPAASDVWKHPPQNGPCARRPLASGCFDSRLDMGSTCI
jgi:hypothetical protein